MEKRKKVFVFLGLIFVISLSFYAYLGFFVPRSLNNKISDQKFIIKEGSSLSKIADNLQKQGLIRHGIFFKTYLILKKEQGNIKIGGYLLNPFMAIQEISDILVQGKTSSINVTIQEGWKIEDIAEHLESFNIVQKKEFYRALENYNRDEKSESLAFLSQIPQNASLEGFLFPDSYLLEIDVTAEEIIEMMLKNFDLKAVEKTKEAPQEKYSFFEIITMASLLEKEVRGKEDKELVSGILWKRLEHGVPLELCSTIIYLTGKKDTKISPEEIKIDSPYNTYLYSGLPPGPIANPGLESILAAFNPKPSPYWYYLSTLEGETLFSATIEEHNIKKAKYLK